MTRLLVFRFSAMGDVAMTVPVIRELLNAHPELEIVMVSRKAFQPFFQGMERLRFHVLEPQGRHKGLQGLYRLYTELRNYTPTGVANLHNNLRSNILSTFFRLLARLPLATLDKGRQEKKALTRKTNKILIPLRSTHERYADVFRMLGFPLQLSHQLTRKPQSLPLKVKHIFSDPQTRFFVGIAPFAKHREKVYPHEKMEELIQKLGAYPVRIFLFGGGPQEAAIAERWTGYPGVCSVINELSLAEELNLISNLDLMISMDSSGMHMASLTGTPVVSIWGGTHPYAGFLGYGQAYEDCMQVELSCRPSSVYGNKACERGDLACLYRIDSGMIVEHVWKKLNDAKRPLPDTAR